MCVRCARSFNRDFSFFFFFVVSSSAFWNETRYRSSFYSLFELICSPSPSLSCLTVFLLFYLYDLRWAAAAYDTDVARSSTFSGVFLCACVLPVAVVRAMYFSSFCVSSTHTHIQPHKIDINNYCYVKQSVSVCVCVFSHLISVVFETLSCAFIRRDHWFKFIYVFHSLMPAPSSHHTNGLFKNNIKKAKNDNGIGATRFFEILHQRKNPKTTTSNVNLFTYEIYF